MPRTELRFSAIVQYKSDVRQMFNNLPFRYDYCSWNDFFKPSAFRSSPSSRLRISTICVPPELVGGTLTISYPR